MYEMLLIYVFGGWGFGVGLSIFCIGVLGVLSRDQEIRRQIQCFASAPQLGIQSFYIPTNYDSSPLEMCKLAGSVSWFTRFVGLPLINEWELCFQSIPKFDTRSFYIPTHKILTPLCPLQYVYIDPRFIIYNSCDNTSKLSFLQYFYRRL